MKKLFTTSEFKRKNKRRLQSLKKKKLKEKRRSKPFLKMIRIPCDPELTDEQKRKGIKRIRPSIKPPDDFRLLENTGECLHFFGSLRNNSNCSIINTDRFARISLTDVKQIDYATINVLIAISRELKNRKIALQGNFPEDELCKDMMVDSGFLNYMYNDKNQPFPALSKSDTFFFKKGEGKLLETDNILISNTIRKAVKHLTGEDKPNFVIKSLLLEMCGNSIEHAESIGKQWLLGVKYEENRVLFSVTDVGLGILETLHKKFRHKLEELFTSNTNLSVLEGAFNKKYGSKTQEPNRNKGLPFIKLSSENKILLNLIVLTNDVILYFDSNSKSQLLKGERNPFKGTMYQWELTKDSITKSEHFLYELNN